MARMTALQISQLDNMNAASQRAGGLGTLIDTIQYGGIATPDAGNLNVLSAIEYSIAPVLGTATKVHAAIPLLVGTQTIITGITNPDVPRLVSVKGNDANVTGNVVITGTDINDNVITNTIALNAANEVAGTKAFKTVTSIALPTYAVAGTETVSIGTTAKIGLPVAVPNASVVIAKTFDGSADAGTVTASATLEGSVYATAGTYNGAKIVSLVILA